MRLQTERHQPRIRLPCREDYACPGLSVVGAWHTPEIAVRMFM